jgi:hypothetical protein
MYQFQVNFSESMVLKYAALQYQAQLLVMCLLPLISAVALPYLSFPVLLLICYVLATLTACVPRFLIGSGRVSGACLNSNGAIR